MRWVCAAELSLNLRGYALGMRRETVIENKRLREPLDKLNLTELI